MLDFPGGSNGKASVYNAGDPGSNPRSGRSPGEENGNHSSTIAWKIPWTEEPGKDAQCYHWEMQIKTTTGHQNAQTIY